MAAIGWWFPALCVPYKELQVSTNGYSLDTLHWQLQV